MVTLAQLASLGFPASTVRARVIRGAMQRIAPRVYAVGHTAICRSGMRLGAVLSVGAGAVLSHWSAAAVWGLLDDPGRAVHVTVAAKSRSHDWIRVHRARELSDRDCARRHGLPLTTPSRTLLDLAAVAQPRTLLRAVNEALVLKLVDEPSLHAQIARAGGRRGVAALSRLLDDDAAPTRSELEDRLLALVRRANLPEPQVNATVRTARGPREADLLFAAQRVIVEADGARFHDNRLARRNDADKQALLEDAGYRVMRTDWRQVTEQPAQTIRRLKAALDAGEVQR